MTGDRQAATDARDTMRNEFEVSGLNVEYSRSDL